MSARIEWRSGKYSFDYGYLGGKELFSVGYSITRNDPLPWRLNTNLPGPYPGQRDFETNPEAKDYAERFLVAWVKSIGAEFPVLTSMEENEA